MNSEFKNNLLKVFMFGLFVGVVVGIITTLRDFYKNNPEETKDTSKYNIEYFAQTFNIPKEDIVKYDNYVVIEDVFYDLYTFDNEYGDTLEASIIVSEYNQSIFTYLPDGTREPFENHELYK